MIFNDCENQYGSQRKISVYLALFFSLLLYIFILTYLQPLQGDDLDVGLIWADYTRIETIEQYVLNIVQSSYSEFFRTGAILVAPYLAMIQHKVDFFYGLI